MFGLTAAKSLSAQVREAELRKTDIRRNIEQSIVNAFYSSISAKELVQSSYSQVASAQESLRLAMIRLEAGVGIYTDVINAQLTETQARINYLNSIIGYNIAQAQLLYDMGIISANSLLEGYNLAPMPLKLKNNIYE
ncbi:MAG: TolC family protein [Desulfobacterales bacterium]|nr:TolC family protein [Desulfobacterales bacterium]